jgi:hypothetical protein
VWRYGSLLVIFGQCRSAWRQAVHSFRPNCVAMLHNLKFVHARNDKLSLIESLQCCGVCVRVRACVRTLEYAAVLRKCSKIN